MFVGKRFRVFVALMLVIGTAGIAVATASGGAPPQVVRLHLGSDDRSFQYGDVTQPLTTTSNSCKISSTGSVIALSSTGSKSVPGLGPDGSIGVKGTPSSGNGTPCSQIDNAESLQLKPGTSMTGTAFSGVQLDLEMTGNAIVKLTLASNTTSAVYQLQTGTSINPLQSNESDYDTVIPYTASSSPGDTTDACAAANSSGPNSGPSDNCQWTVQPGFSFTTVTLTTVSVGTMSLEGGNDFGGDPAFDTLFFVANSPPVANDDSADVDQGGSVTIAVLQNDTDIDGDALTPTDIADISPAGSTAVANADGTVTFTPPSSPAPGYTGPASFTYKASDGTASSNTATVSVTVFPVICSNDTVSTTDVDVTGSFTRLDDTLNCKRYALESSAADGTVLFKPTGGGAVDYRGFVFLGGSPAPTPGGPGTVTLLLRYDPTGGNTFRPVQWCVDPQFDDDDLVTTATVPAGETWCIASADTRADSHGDLGTRWQVFGHDDPKFR